MIQYQNRRWGEKEKNEVPKKKELLLIFLKVEHLYLKLGRLLKIHHSTVSTFIGRYLLRGELENRRRSGRPKTITPGITEN